ATPADAALMMQFGMDGIFVGSGIFKSDDPNTMAKAIVEATAHFDDPELVGNVSKNLGDAMSGLEEAQLETKMASRGH
ncbi:MAG: pyridoxal 5'-phosphate synthase lyase subunit PdxS, partial [Candidatus Poseidoniia archaeon]|nr:pyridoxal 5'-phosphate synthase lyase subunit PdxS [Candidatus Poseidoniia archaeon]